MQNDETENVSELPPEPEVGSNFRLIVGHLTEQAKVAKLKRQQAEQAEAEAAARMAEMDAAALGEAENVVPLRRDASPALTAIAGGKAAEENEVDGADTTKRSFGPKGGGSFFSIDRRIWHRVCRLGLNAGIAYLCLARGAGRSRSSSWSVNSITTYTGIGPKRALQAIDALVSAGIVKKLRGGSRPLYELPSFSEIGEEVKPALSEEERRVLAIVLRLTSDKSPSVSIPKVGRHDNAWSYGNPYEAALQLARKGHLQHKGGHTFSRAPQVTPEAAAEHMPIWLPNALVEGAASETPPIELVRQSQNPFALRLFVDLYFSQSLADERGIQWRTPGLRQSYERKQIGEAGPYIIWAFYPRGLTATGKGPGWELMTGEPGSHEERSKAFWEALDILERAGLLIRVPHLVDSDDFTTAEVIHPLATYKQGETAEADLRVAALDAAKALISEDRVYEAYGSEYPLIAPIDAIRSKVTAIGIYRLTYKPGTSASAIWRRNLDECLQWTRAYRALQVLDYSGARKAMANGANGESGR